MAGRPKRRARLAAEKAKQDARYKSLRDGYWENGRGDHIRRVNPRGKTLYCVQLVGARRPEWFDTLDQAKAYRAA